MHFARVLRGAGLPVGTDRVGLALDALPLAGLESRADLHAALTACLVDRPEHQLLFDQAFHLFWRDPDLRGRMMAMLLPRVEGRKSGVKPPQNRRLADALFPKRADDRPPPREETTIEAVVTVSDRERLFKADFETMTTGEWNEARRVIATLPFAAERIATRRTRRSAHGRLDWRRTMQASARGDVLALRRRAPRTRAVPLVVIADISGSMSRYSRMLLHFAHALSTQRSDGAQRVSSFVFGTRLTSITRALRDRDPDLAIASVVNAVDDWSGGTRIAACLAEFNAHWSRRVLAQNATVLLITDGLELGDTTQLAFETERLAKSCRKLVWLNPLLRYAGFEPKAAGVRAMLPHVDRFVPAHNLESIAALGAVLSAA
ncbi:MAG: VWA domain-containing protein [Burkholderiaceae bacterium]